MRLALTLLITTTAFAQDVEQLTEQLSYTLHDFSAATRKGKQVDLTRHFAPTVVGRAHALTMFSPYEEIKGIEIYQWVVKRETHALPATQFLERLTAPWNDVRDVAFAPVSSRVRDGKLVAKVKFYVVGRRTASRGLYRVTVESGKITSFLLESGTTLRVKRDWFTDATPEQMKAEDPAVLDHPTLGLAAYGAATADVDGDGRMDVFSTGHDTNRLYLNRGNGKFAMVEVKTPRQATAPLFLDYDNDGDPDLFLSANGKQMLLENRQGKFVDVSAEAGVDKATIGFSAVAGDINGDGFPDIYVTAYNNYGPVAPASWDNARNGLPNLLFVSQGDGTYVEAAKTWQVAGNRWSYAAQFIDINGDGKLDLYVANDFGAGNAFYIHKGDHFVDAAAAWGVTDNGYGMGVSFGDFDNDGDFDLHVTRMSSKAGNRILDRLQGVDGLRPLASGNSLLENVRGKSFRDISKTAGPFPAGWGWGGGFLDIDNDGLLDLHTPNGFMSGHSMKDT
ncbi:MAG: VCBS repeat-containing protein [Planctomycetota bacterium]|nr:VCBS repeat-containing protein [Planctomycetota bacterium]